MLKLQTHLNLVPYLALYGKDKSYEVWGVSNAERRFLKGLASEVKHLEYKDESILMVNILDDIKLFIRQIDLKDAEPAFSKHILLPRVLEHLTSPIIQNISNKYERITFCVPEMLSTTRWLIQYLQDVDTLYKIRANYEICNEFEDWYHDAHKWFTSKANIRALTGVDSRNTIVIGGFEQIVGTVEHFKEFPYIEPKFRTFEPTLENAYHAMCFKPLEIPYLLLQVYELGYNEIPVLAIKNPHEAFEKKNILLQLPNGDVIKTFLTPNFLSHLLKMDKILEVKDEIDLDGDYEGFAMVIVGPRSEK